MKPIVITLIINYNRKMLSYRLPTEQFEIVRDGGQWNSRCGNARGDWRDSGLTDESANPLPPQLHSPS